MNSGKNSSQIVVFFKKCMLKKRGGPLTDPFCERGLGKHQAGGVLN